MTLDDLVKSEIQKAVDGLFQYKGDLPIQPTNQEFAGSHTLVCFPLAKSSKLSPPETAQRIGQQLKTQAPEIFQDFNVVKGFLNLVVSDRGA